MRVRLGMRANVRNVLDGKWGFQCVRAYARALARLRRLCFRAARQAHAMRAVHARVRVRPCMHVCVRAFMHARAGGGRSK